MQGLTEEIVKTKGDVYELIKRGSQKRQTAATKMNSRSSRSHSVFTITIQTFENDINHEEMVTVSSRA